MSVSPEVLSCRGCVLNGSQSEEEIELGTGRWGGGRYGAGQYGKKVDNTAESHDTLVNTITVDSAVELDTVPL